MSTSGTVALTNLDTVKIIEHAFRRCKVPTAKQTAEAVMIAKENLYLLLTALSNRGLNLWCVETQYVGLTDDKATYVAPAGTVDILNVIYTQPTRTEGTDTTAATSVATELDASTQIYRIGIKCSAITASDTLTLAQSANGSSWTTISTHTKTDWATSTWYWFNLDPSVTNVHFRASFGSAATFTEFYLASALYDLPVSQWNRDTWSTLNNKNTSGRPSTCYYFEKKLTPQLTLWPVPNNNYDHLTLFLHRQIQDVGTMVQNIEVPQRWVESIIWQLTVRLAFELPEVPGDIISAVTAMSQQFLLEVEDEESDGAPLYITPNIRGYTA